MTTPPAETNPYAYLQQIGTLLGPDSKRHVIVDADEVIIGHPNTDALQTFLAAWHEQGKGKWPALRSYVSPTHPSGLVMPVHWHLLADFIARGAKVEVSKTHLVLIYPNDLDGQFAAFVERCKDFGLIVQGKMDQGRHEFPLIAQRITLEPSAKGDGQ